MSNALSRMRHRLGFGVHSPFAFRFVRDVIQSPKGCSYYSSFRLLRLLAPLPRHLRREYSLLFRLAARLRPRAIYLPQGDDDRMDDTLHLACPAVKCRRRFPTHAVSNTLIICEAAEIPSQMIAGLMSTRNILVIRNMPRNTALTGEIAGRMPGGWTFEDCKMGIFISEPGEPLNRLSVKLV